jgi:hypothetical protein
MKPWGDPPQRRNIMKFWGDLPSEDRYNETLRRPLLRGEIWWNYEEIFPHKIDIMKPWGNLPRGEIWWNPGEISPRGEIWWNLEKMLPQRRNVMKSWGDLVSEKKFDKIVKRSLQRRNVMKSWVDLPSGEIEWNLEEICPQRGNIMKSFRDLSLKGKYNEILRTPSWEEEFSEILRKSLRRGDKMKSWGDLPSEERYNELLMGPALRWEIYRNPKEISPQMRNIYFMKFWRDLF